MAFDNRDSIDFGKENIPKLFRSIFIPTVLGMLFNAVFVLTDGVFIGHGVGAAGLASVNLVAPIMMAITGLGMMFGSGCAVVAAIHLAQSKVKVARINITQSFIACLLLSLLLVLFFYTCPQLVFRILGVSDSLHELAMDYYLWFLPTCVFLMIQIWGEFVIRLDGSPRYVMCANIIPAVINIILDYTFIFPCNLGLKGAALATDIGCGVGAVMTLFYMFFLRKQLSFYPLKMTRTSNRLAARNIGYMIRLGFAAFLSELAISVMMLAGNIAFAKQLGDAGVAAYSVICYLFPVVNMIYIAVAQSAQPIISFNYGAKQEKRVHDAFRYSLIVSLLIGALATLIFFLFTSSMVSAFIESTDRAHILAVGGLPWYSLSFVFIAFNVAAIGYFQSVEKITMASLMMTLRGIVLPVVAFLFLPMIIGEMGLWLAIPMAEMFTTLVELIYFVFLRREIAKDE